jgi:hypothetical protein
MTSGFRTAYYGGTVDLDELFKSGSGSGTTGFVAQDGKDLAQRYAPRVISAYDFSGPCGFTAQDGRDLTQWFLEKGFEDARPVVWSGTDTVDITDCQYEVIVAAAYNLADYPGTPTGWNSIGTVVIPGTAYARLAWTYATTPDISATFSSSTKGVALRFDAMSAPSAVSIGSATSNVVYSPLTLKNYAGDNVPALVSYALTYDVNPPAIPLGFFSISNAPYLGMSAAGRDFGAASYPGDTRPGRSGYGYGAFIVELARSGQGPISGQLNVQQYSDGTYTYIGYRQGVLGSWTPTREVAPLQELVYVPELNATIVTIGGGQLLGAGIVNAMRATDNPAVTYQSGRLGYYAPQYSGPNDLLQLASAVGTTRTFDITVGL